MSITRRRRRRRYLLGTALSSFRLLALGPALSLAACAEPDGISFPGALFTYVVSEATVATSGAQAATLGLDLNGDGAIDNRLGAGLAGLTPGGLDLQSAMARAIDRGDVLLLLDLEAQSLARQHRAGLQVHIGDGASAAPAPCASPTDAVCRGHLDGTGSFVIAASSPDDFPLVGELAGGTFDGGPGELSIELALGAATPTRLHLIGARVKASGLAAGGIGRVVIAGGLPAEELAPTLLGGVAAAIAADCPGGAPPGCGCARGSTGATLISVFDRSPQDCAVTVAELQTNPLVDPAGPDLTIDGRGAYSFGIEAKAVRAAFPAPP